MCSKKLFVNLLVIELMFYSFFDLVFYSFLCFCVDWLVDRRTDRWADWLTDWPTDRPTDQPTNRPTDRPTVRPTDWLTDWLAISTELGTFDISNIVTLTNFYIWCCFLWIQSSFGNWETKGTLKIIYNLPESLWALLEYLYIEHGLLSIDYIQLIDLPSQKETFVYQENNWQYKSIRRWLELPFISSLTPHGRVRYFTWKTFLSFLL